MFVRHHASEFLKLMGLQVFFQKDCKDKTLAGNYFNLDKFVLVKAQKTDFFTVFSLKDYYS
jgi:hypothetical protein